MATLINSGKSLTACINSNNNPCTSTASGCGYSSNNTISVSNSGASLALTNSLNCRQDSCNRNRQLPVVIENLSANNAGTGNSSNTTGSYDNINNVNKFVASGKCSSNIAFPTLTITKTSTGNILEQRQQTALSPYLQSPFATLPFIAGSVGVGVGGGGAVAGLSSASKSSTSSLSSKAYPSINSAYWLPSPHPSPYAIPGMSSSILWPACVRLCVYQPPLGFLETESFFFFLPTNSLHIVNCSFPGVYYHWLLSKTENDLN